MKHFLAFFIFIVCLSSCKNQEEKKDIPIIANNVKVFPAIITELTEKANNDSSNVSLKINLVEALDSLGFKKEALYQIDKLIATDSLNNTFWLKRGQLCKVLEDTPSAIKSFHYAAKIYPTPLALMELANLYAETKNAKAITICKQLMSMNPDGNYDAQANFFIGIYFSKINDIPNAIKYFDLTIEKDFHFDDAYIEKGYLLYNYKKFDAALKVFKQLLAVNQTSADGYYWQAKTYEALNKFSEAVSSYNKALVFNADLSEAKEAIARLSSIKN